MKKSRCVYRCVDAQMKINGIDSVELSEMAGINYQMFRRKMLGTSPFLLDEAIKIHNIIGKAMTIEELFERSD